MKKTAVTQGSSKNVEDLNTMSDTSPVSHMPGEEVATLVNEIAGVAISRAASRTLTQILRQCHTEMRTTAAQILGTSSKRIPLDSLRSALHDPEPSVRKAAVQALGGFGTEVPFNLLEEALHDSEEDIQLAALGAALNAWGADAPRALLEAALDAPSFTVRIEAAAVLQRLERPVPLERLKEGLAHGEAAIQRTAAQALNSHSESSPLDTIKAARKLGFFRQRMPVEALIDALRDPDPWLRKQAVEGLVRLGAQAPVDALVTVLQQDRDAGVRSYTVDALSKLEEYTPIEALIAALNDPAPGVRLYAVRSLARLGKRAPVGALLRAFEENDKAIQSVIASALDDLGVPGWAHPHLKNRSTEAVVESLRDQAHAIRLEAIKALLERPPGEIPLEPVVAALQSPQNNKDLRLVVVEVLRRLGERLPIEPLVKALEADPDHDVRVAVAEVLAEQGVRAPVEALIRATINDPVDVVREEVCWALKGLSEDAAVELLIPFLGSRDALRRQTAVDVLTRSRPREALRPVLQEAEAILLGERSGTVLGSILQSTLAEGIGMLRLASRQALQHLITLLEWPHWEVQAEAAKAIGKLPMRIPLRVFDTLKMLQSPGHPRPVQDAATKALRTIHAE